MMDPINRMIPAGRRTKREKIQNTPRLVPNNRGNVLMRLDSPSAAKGPENTKVATAAYRKKHPMADRSMKTVDKRLPVSIEVSP